MFRLAAFLAFSALLAFPVECEQEKGKKTFFSVDYTVKCKNAFSYTATLFEHDTLGNDVIAKETKKNQEIEASGTLSGHQVDDGPLDKTFEIFIRIEHDCQGTDAEKDVWLKEPVCKVGDKECIYPAQTISLE